MKLRNLLFVSACCCISTAEAGYLDFGFTSPMALGPYTSASITINEGTSGSIRGYLSYHPDGDYTWVDVENVRFLESGYSGWTHIFRTNNVYLGSNTYNFSFADEGFHRFRAEGYGIEHLTVQVPYTYSYTVTVCDFYFLGCWSSHEETRYGTGWRTEYREQGIDVHSASLDITVVNVAPTITSLQTDRQFYFTHDTANFSATATDPGAMDVLHYDWDLDSDGFYDDFAGASGNWLYNTAGTYNVGVRVSDEDGGVAYRSSTITVVAPQPPPPPPPPPPNNIPEPTSMALLGFALAGLGVSRKMQKPK